MSKAEIWEKIKSFVVVLVIALLIWFVADLNVSTSKTFQIPVRVVALSQDRYAAIAEPAAQTTFTVTFWGRRRHINEFGDLVASKDFFEAVIDQSYESSDRPQSVSARELFRDIKEIAGSHLNVQKAQPANVAVLVADYVTVPNVQVDPDFGDLKVSATTCSPAKVSVRLPRFAAARLRADPVIRPDVEKIVRQGRKPDGTFQVRVPLGPEFENLDPAAVTLTPSDEITLTGRIETLTATERKGPVQITWSMPHQVQQRFEIVADPSTNFRPDIDVTGPKELLEQLDPRDIRGFVTVMAADMEEPGKEITRAVQFVLPPGFELAPESPPHEITFKLVPRPAALPSGG